MVAFWAVTPCSLAGVVISEEHNAFFFRVEMERVISAVAIKPKHGGEKLFEVEQRFYDAPCHRSFTAKDHACVEFRAD